MERFQDSVYDLHKLIRQDELKQTAVQQLDLALSEAVSTVQFAFPSVNITPHEAMELIWMLRSTTNTLAKHKDVLDILCTPKERLRLFIGLAEKVSDKGGLIPAEVCMLPEPQPRNIQCGKETSLDSTPSPASPLETEADSNTHSHTGATMTKALLKDDALSPKKR